MVRVEPSSQPQPVQAQFEPSSEWLDQLASQCTPQLLQRLARYATYQLAQIAKFGHVADAYAARELVQDALYDTTVGALRWDPAERTLEQHLINVLRLRGKRARMHAERYPRLALESSDESDAPNTGTSKHVNAAMAQLRARAQDDDLVVRMLDAINQGAETRDDIVHLTGFSKSEYHNSRRRLNRLVNELDLRPTRSRGTGDGI